MISFCNAANRTEVYLIVKFESIRNNHVHNELDENDKPKNK